MDIINKPEPTAGNTQLLYKILERLNAVEESLAALRLQLNKAKRPVHSKWQHGRRKSAVR